MVIVINAYGVMLTKDGDTNNLCFYCGEQLDEATSLYYLWVRYMNSLTATFTQMDTYEEELNSSLNVFRR